MKHYDGVSIDKNLTGRMRAQTCNMLKKSNPFMGVSALFPHFHCVKEIDTHPLIQYLQEAT